MCQKAKRNHWTSVHQTASQWKYLTPNFLSKIKVGTKSTKKPKTFQRQIKIQRNQTHHARLQTLCRLTYLQKNENINGCLGRKEKTILNTLKRLNLVQLARVHSKGKKIPRIKEKNHPDQTTLKCQSLIDSIQSFTFKKCSS